MAIAQLREHVTSAVTQGLGFQVSSRGPVALTSVAERLLPVVELLLRFRSLAAGIQTLYYAQEANASFSVPLHSPSHWLFLV